jgi:hypothetical protein
MNSKNILIVGGTVLAVLTALMSTPIVYACETNCGATNTHVSSGGGGTHINNHGTLGNVCVSSGGTSPVTASCNSGGQ